MQTFDNLRAILRAVRAGKIPPAHVMSAPEAIAELDISRQSLDALIVSGKIDGWRAGRFVLVDSQTVAALKAERGK